MGRKGIGQTEDGRIGDGTNRGYDKQGVGQTEDGTNKGGTKKKEPAGVTAGPSFV